MNHETVERVARAIYDAIEKNANAAAFDDGCDVSVKGIVNFLDCACAAIEAYKEASNGSDA